MARSKTEFSPRACTTLKEFGFTLVELMTVLAIAVILLSLGVPGFRSLIERQRMVTTVNDFVAAIYLTRAEAIQRGTRVDLVPAGSDWDQGWRVFVDENDNQEVDEGEHVAFLRGSVPEGMSVAARLSDTATKYLSYNGTGRTRTNANSQQPQYGSFRFRLGEQKRNVVINMLGRVRICTPASADETC